MEGIEGVGFYAIEGVRFYPKDEELILVLEEKRLHPAFSLRTVLDYNIYEYEPFELFELPGVRRGEKWCNFFCAPDFMKEDSSQRLQELAETGYCGDSVKRSTRTGYWKVTGITRSIKAKKSKKEIGHKRTLVFYERPPGSKGIRTNWVMQEFVIRYDPSFKEDFVLCRIKRKRDKKPCISTKNENRRAKKSCTSTKIDDMRARKACTSTKIGDRRAKPEKVRTSTKIDGRQAKKSRISAKNETRDLKSCVSFNDEAQPSYNVVFNDGISNHFVENSSPKSNWYVISNGNHVAENFSPEFQPGAELLPVPGCDSTSNSGDQVAEAPEHALQVDPLPRAKQNLLNGCIVLDQTTFFALPSLIYPELRPLPSCDSISNSGHHVAGASQYISLPSVLSGCSGLASFFPPQSPVYPASQPLASCDLISNCGHHVAEAPKYTSQQDPLPVIPSVLNGYSQLDQMSSFAVQSPIYPESQQLPSCNSTSNSAHHVSEAPKYTSQEDPRLAIPSVLNGYSQLDQMLCFALQPSTYPELLPPPSCNSISNCGQHAADTPEYSTKVDPLSCSKPSAFNSCGGLEQTSFSVHPEKEISYSSVTNSDYDVLNCPLGFEWDDYFISNPPPAVRV